MNIEKQKEHFKDHIATLRKYDNITILDFENPDCINYRIRFLFEEDRCVLHISGDLGREEAISCFHKFMDNEPISIPTLEKAMQVAIKALEQDSVLDKIRAEIVELTKCPYGTECLGANCPSNTDCMICGDHVLEILDKYKAESEEWVNFADDLIPIIDEAESKDKE